MIFRHRALILTIVFVMVAAAWVVVSVVTPEYTGEAFLMVGDQQQHALDPQTGVIAPNAEITGNDIEVIKSRHNIQAVIEKLGLLKDPTINPTLRHSKFRFLERWMHAAEQDWVKLTAMFHTAAPLEAAVDAGPVMLPGDGSEAIMSRTIDNALRHLTVGAVGRSRVVSVAFQAQNPRTAAAVANAIADAYIQDDLNSHMQASAQANKLFADSVNEMRNQVIDTDRAVQERKAAAGLMQGKQDDLIKEQISSLSEQLTLASAARAQAEARMLRGGGDGPNAEAVAIEASPLLQQLRASQAALQQRIAQAAQVMGEKTPTMRLLRAEFAANADTIKRETARIAGAARTSTATSRARDVAVARAQEGALRSELTALEARANAIGSTDVDIRAQQREADANHNLFDRLLVRAKETSIEGGLLKPDAHLVSAAEPPPLPSYPNKFVALALAAVGGILGGLLVAFLLETTDRGFRDLAQAEAALGIPGLGYVPQLRSGEQPEKQIIESPFSAYSESIRSLYTALRISNGHCPPKSVLVASALPDEGKTSISLSLGRLAARGGKRVLIIDADMRNPSLHRVIGATAGPGLIDHLCGNVPLEETLARDPESSALILPAGVNVPSLPDAFASEEMMKLMQRLASQFDLVIIDSAPLLAVSDTCNLCRLVEKVFLVARWQRTRAVAARPALHHLLRAGADVAGVVLSMASLKELPTYSDAAYYHPQVLNYIEYKT